MRTVTDGPFAETKEFVAGYFVIACESRDEAIEWAAKLGRGSQAVEVRPVWESTRAAALVGALRRGRPRCAGSGRPHRVAPTATDAGWTPRRSTVIIAAAMDRAELATFYRDEFGRILASVIRAVGDFHVAEEAVQEAFARRARSSGRATGGPTNPRAWLIATARHKAIDVLRRARALRGDPRRARPPAPSRTSSPRSPDPTAPRSPTSACA